MRIGKVIGSVTLSGQHPTFLGASLRVVVPQSRENLNGTSDKQAEELIVYDELGAGPGSLIAISEGGEAAQPFRPNFKPVDAYNAAILDQIDM